MQLLSRPRRLRRTPALRAMVRETQLQPADLIQPIFVKAGLVERQEIPSMPGQYQLSLNDLADEVRAIQADGVNAIIVFGVPAEKDEVGSDGFSDNGIIQQSLKIIKAAVPELMVISDICCCEYTSHGHCGVIDDDSGQLDVNNDATLTLLQQQAVSHARAGADVLAPSGMMDGMVLAIREALDKAGFSHLPIMSYAVKYASAMYGPFREAAEGAPQFGDRQTYQMDVANGDEALKEAALDVEEGADMLMVKPGHTYLDIIYRVKQAFPELPLGAYHPSGEFAMIKAAAEKGWVDEARAVMEVLTSIKRAGADFILTYFARDVCRRLLGGE